MAGINRALLVKNELVSNRVNGNYSAESITPILESILQKRNHQPCIFLSHSSKDKSAVREIGEYIRKKGNIDIYLDEEDAELQNADNSNDPYQVTKSIEKGILTSTHLMCIFSENTGESWWVPYEIGFAKKSSKELSTLKLKGNIYMPDYLEITKIIRGIKSLNSYIRSIENKKAHGSISMESYLTEHYIQHPLDNYLDWNL